jgi:hypothetical protein
MFFDIVLCEDLILWEEEENKSTEDKSKYWQKRLPQTKKILHSRGKTYESTIISYLCQCEGEMFW